MTQPNNTDEIVPTVINAKANSAYAKTKATIAYTGKGSRRIREQDLIEPITEKTRDKTIREEWRNVNRSIECRENRIKVLQSEILLLEKTRNKLKDAYRMDLTFRIDKLTREKDEIENKSIG